MEEEEAWEMVSRPPAKYGNKGFAQRSARIFQTL